MFLNTLLNAIKKQCTQEITGEVIRANACKLTPANTHPYFIILLLHNNNNTYSVKDFPIIFTNSETVFSRL